MAARSKTRLLSVRLDEELIRRLNALTERELRPGFRPRLSDVVRMSIAEGLAVLEKPKTTEATQTQEAVSGRKPQRDLKKEARERKRNEKRNEKSLKGLCELVQKEKW